MSVWDASQSWTAADVSNLMFNRPRCGMSAGMFGSLWKSVIADATIASPSFASAARDGKSFTGMPLTLAEVLRLCGFEGVCASLRRERARVATVEHDK